MQYPKFVFGALAPWENTNIQVEFDALRVPGVCAATARFDFINTPDVSSEIKNVALNLMRCGPRAMLLMLSPELAPHGMRFLRRVCDDLRNSTGLPVFNATESIHAALAAMDIRRVSVVTPSRTEQTNHACAVLEESGFEVCKSIGLDKASSEIAATPQQEIEDAVLDADDDECEAIIQIGGGLPCFGVVDVLERRLGKPVITCNGATYWQALRETGNGTRITGFGQLLADY